MASKNEISIERLNKKLLGIVKDLKNPLPANNVAAEIMLRSVRRNFRDGGRPRKWKPSRRALQTGHKTLIGSTRSLMTKITKRVGKHFVEVGLTDKRARLLNYGGKVVPKTAQYLTIPIGLTENEKRLGMKARDFKNTYFARASTLDLDRKEKLFLMQNMGKGEKPRVLFLLTKSITMPARPFMLFQKQDIVLITKEYARHILKEVS